MKNNRNKVDDRSHYEGRETDQTSTSLIVFEDEMFEIPEQ